MRLLAKLQWIRAPDEISEAIQAIYNLVTEWQKGELDSEDFNKAIKEIIEAIIALGLIKE